jgi:hypothetical protein
MPRGGAAHEHGQWAANTKRVEILLNVLLQGQQAITAQLSQIEAKLDNLTRKNKGGSSEKYDWHALDRALIHFASLHGINSRDELIEAADAWTAEMWREPPAERTIRQHLSRIAEELSLPATSGGARVPAGEMMKELIRGTNRHQPALTGINRH